MVKRLLLDQLGFAWARNGLSAQSVVDSCGANTSVFETKIFLDILWILATWGLLETGISIFLPGRAIWGQDEVHGWTRDSFDSLRRLLKQISRPGLAILCISSIFFTHFVDHPVLNIPCVFPIRRNYISCGYRLSSKDFLQLTIIYAVHLGLNVEVSLRVAILVCGKCHGLIMLYP